MAREKKKAPISRSGVRAVARRAKLDRTLQQDGAWRALNPLKAPPKLKHKTYFELVDNADKKKKLEFKITTDRHPPPGFEFVPIGHPRLTQACKDLSRDQDAMIFIVSNSTNPENLDHHMNRVGYHFRGTIVDQARMAVEEDGQLAHVTQAHRPGVPEPIPETQEEINQQADAVLRDLFPRIPNIDRKEIIQHAFQKDGKFHGEFKVGMAQGLTLARRVQLAAIAFIRHQHTRYDELLKKTSWANARRAVEKPCLDIIVKWRGDEETGRDQLDEILREVIEISDTEEESEDDIRNSELASAQYSGTVPATASPRNRSESQELRRADNPSPSQAHRHDPPIPSVLMPSRQKAIAKAEKKSARKTQRFRRYAAAAEALASGSSRQTGHANESNMAYTNPIPMDLTMSPVPARQVYSSREPTVVITRGTPNTEQTPRHIELRADSQRFNGDHRRERMVTVTHSLPEGSAYPPRPIHNMDSHRPKVGHLPIGYSNEQVPVSPIGHGLQDMLLPSIEPPSPAGPHAPRDAPHILYREPQHFAEAPRIIPRGVNEPMGSAPFQSPRDMVYGNELNTKRYRLAGHSVGERDAYNTPSFFPINQQGRGEDPRREPVRYFSDRPVPSFERSQHQAWPVNSDRMVYYHDDTSIGSRTNPIIMDDTFRRPHQVVEVQRHPDRDYQAVPPRREDTLRDIPARDPRTQDVQDNPRIVYIREGPSRPRSSHDHFGTPINHHGYGLTTREESNSFRSPTSGHRQHMTFDTLPEYGHRGYREPSPSQRFGRQPPRDVRTFDPGFGAPEVRYTSAQHDLYERPPIPISEDSPNRRQTYRQELMEPMNVVPQQIRHEQAYTNPPIHHEYIESHTPLLQHHAPEPRRVVYVDR